MQSTRAAFVRNYVRAISTLSLSLSFIYADTPLSYEPLLFDRGEIR